MSDDEDEDDPDERNPGRNKWRFPKGCAYMIHVLSLFPLQNAFGINVSYLTMNFTTQTKEKEMILVARRRA
jgi:hypothetical protein